MHRAPCCSVRSSPAIQCGCAGLRYNTTHSLLLPAHPSGAPPDSSKEGQLAAVGQQQQQQQQQERPPPPPPPPQQQQQLSPRPSPCTPAGSRLRGAAGDLDDLRNRMDCLTVSTYIQQATDSPRDGDTNR